MDKQVEKVNFYLLVICQQINVEGMTKLEKHQLATTVIVINESSINLKESSIYPKV